LENIVKLVKTSK